MYIPPPPNVAFNPQYSIPRPTVPSIQINQQDSTPSTENGVELIVYIGNLPIKLSNEAAINILQKCGSLTHWRRQSDPTNDTFATFGFCQFTDCQGAHNALTLLAGLELQKKTIKVSCNDKVKYQLAGWLAKREAHLLDHAEEEEVIKATEAAVKKDLQGLLAEQDILLEKESKRLKALYDDRLKRRESGLTENLDTSDSLKKKKKSEEEKLDYTYLSKDYKVHWKESERRNRIRIKDKEILGAFIRTEKEWLKDEEQMFKYIARKREYLGKIRDRDREKAMEEDESADCILDRDMIRRLTRERRLDSEDLEDELRVIREEEDKILQQKRQMEEERMRLLEEQRRLEREQQAEEERRRQLEEQKRLEEERRIQEELQAELERKRAEEERKKMPTVQKFVFAPKAQTSKEVIPIKPIFEAERSENNNVTTPFQQKNTSEKSGKFDPKAIMSMVPKQMNEIFAYKIDWNIVEINDIINGKLKPWIRKKIIEYMGNDEKLVAQVVDYILSRISQHKNPSTLLEDVERFLDQEAPAFIMGLWRLLIYEILCKSTSNCV